MTRQTPGLVTLLARAIKYLYGLKCWLALESFDHQDNRDVVYRFIAEHSLFRTVTGEDRARPDGGAALDASAAAACLEGHGRSTPGGVENVSGAVLPPARPEEHVRFLTAIVWRCLHYLIFLEIRST